MKCYCILKRIFFSVALNTLAFSASLAQTNKVAKNFPGLFAGIEWNTISGSWGVEYERFLYTKGPLAIGAKAAYVTKYEYGNLKILSGTCCESASQMLVMGMGSYYTGRRMNFSGFFLHGGLGAGVEQLKYESQDQPNKRTAFRPAFELGPGWQFAFGNSLALRFKAAATYGPFKGAFTSTTVSFGF